MTAVLYAPNGYHKAQRVLVIAKYSGKDVELNTGDVPSNINRPANAVPVYNEGDLTLFETNSICYYLGNEQLRGGGNWSQTSQWCNYSDLVLLPAVSTLVLPCLGLMQFNKNENDKARKEVDDELKFINKYLSTKTFLVGERISQADITLFSVLKNLYEMIYDEPSRRSLVFLNRWFLTIANQENVVAVFGEVKLCETPAKFDAKKYAELHPSAKKSEKQEKKPKEQKASKKEKKPKEEVEEEEEEPKPVEKECPFSLLPKGTFDLMEWKKVFSNNDIETVALPYFWDHFDSENYSIWECEYLYPEELSLLFMTSNLVGGMFQRLEKLVKYAFASMLILGENKDNTIKGLWVWRGQELAFTLSADCQTDYESYKWEKCDPNSDETKEKVKKYFMQKGDFIKPVASSRIFK